MSAIKVCGVGTITSEWDGSDTSSALDVEEAWKRLEADLLAGLDSGVLPPVTPEYWEEKRAALRARLDLKGRDQ